MRALRKLALGLAVVAMSSSAAFAELRAYEGFDYAAGSNLAGQNGGIGFAGPWGTSNGTARIEAPGSVLPPLVTSGNRLYVEGTAGAAPSGTLAIFRDLAAGRGTDGTTTWISLLGERVGPKGGTFGPGGTPSWLRPQNFSLFQGTSEILAIGEGTRSQAPPAQDDDVWGLVDRGGVTNAGTRWTNASLEGESFVLVRIDHGAGNVDTAYIWVNQGLDTEPSVAEALASTTGNWNFNRIRPFAGNPSTASGNIGAMGFYDEFRLGDTWADVAPIPEPSTAVVLGLGAMLLSARRSRRA